VGLYVPLLEFNLCNLRDLWFIPISEFRIKRRAAYPEKVVSQLRRYLLKKSMVRCQASLAAASS
jgi:hypothetical protein